MQKELNSILKLIYVALGLNTISVGINIYAAVTDRSSNLAMYLSLVSLFFVLINITLYIWMDKKNGVE